MAWGLFDESNHTADWTGFLEQGVKLEGNLEASGMFRIDSQMKGTLVSRETLVIGENAAVEGEILGNHVMISGRFDGTIRATSRVEIQPKAIVTGEIHSPCLVIEPGAVFDGQCHMLISGTGTPQSIPIAIRSAVAHA